MNMNPQQQKTRDGALSSLSVAIEAMNLAKEVSSMTPAKAIFGSVSVLLTMIKDSMANKTDWVELGLACADVSRALDRGMNGKKLDDLSQAVCEAIAQLTTTVAEIQRKVIKRTGRNAVSRVAYSKDDKESIVGWKFDLNRILQVFNTELVLNTHVTISDIRYDVSKIREEICGHVCLVSVQTSILGELPPPPPRACFGRDGLIEKVVGLAESLTPLALVGAGGIGKTSIALTVLHHDRIKQRFGDNRRFIRCDQFPASHTHFLNRLSKVIGAGIENPEDLTPLRPFLSSREMILFLDNAETILGLQGPNAREIYAAVEELCRFSNICLCITSRISTVPPDCKRLETPTLSMDAACRTFYRIYDSDKQSNQVNSILEQLDFHPLSITLLATVAHHNKWGTDRLTREWERQRTGLLRAQHNGSLAATIELSLASPMSQELGPDARNLLEVVAFFPQGVDEDNLDWLFPDIPNRIHIFDQFCVLSLAYRTNGFITMLAPLRDHISPKDPTSSPFLCATKDCYFRRLSVDIYPDKPGWEETRWITSEDVNVEHLLDVFTSADTNSVDAWDACCSFMEHLYWHKRRPVILGPKMERLPDDHPSKSQCLFQLAWSFNSVGNRAEYKRLLLHALKLQRERGDDLRVAQTLGYISDANGWLGLYKEGISRARESLEISERLNDIPGQKRTLRYLSMLLHRDGQLDAAEEAASRAIDLLSDKGEEFRVCQYHRLLGSIYGSKGETEKAIHHLGTALDIASFFNWHDQLFWIHYSMALQLSDQDEFGDAHAHVKRAKSHTVNYPYFLGCGMRLQAQICYAQCKFEEGESDALDAINVFEGLGATKDVEWCRSILRNIQEKMK